MRLSGRASLALASCMLACLAGEAAGARGDASTTYGTIRPGFEVKVLPNGRYYVPNVGIAANRDSRGAIVRAHPEIFAGGLGAGDGFEALREKAMRLGPALRGIDEPDFWLQFWTSPLPNQPVLPGLAGEPLLANPRNPFDPNAMPAPPGIATTGVGGVAGTPANYGMSPACPLQDVICHAVMAGKAPQAVKEGLLAPSHRKFISGCDPASASMKAERRKWSRSGPTGVWRAGTAELRTVMEILDAYDSNCLSKPEALREVLSEGAYASIRSRVGILFLKGTGPVCVGTLVAPTLVLTARHCLVDARFRVEWLSFLLEAAPVSHSSFARDQVIHADEYAAMPRGYSPLRDLGDYVLLELDAAPLGDVGRLPFRPPAPYDRLVLYGYQRNAFLADRVRSAEKAGYVVPSPEEGPMAWRRYVRADVSQTCRAAQVTPEGCIIHACQSEMASSGAPLLAPQADGSVAIAGVHIRGGLEPRFGTCDKARSDAAPNVGVVPKGQIARMLREAE